LDCLQGAEMSEIDAFLLWLLGVGIALIGWIIYLIKRVRDEAMMDVLAMLSQFESAIEAREKKE
jgi:hypothetical protein